MFQTPQRQQDCLSRELRDVLQQRNLLTAKSRKKVCSLLQPSSPCNSELDKRNSFRKQALQEIINSEKTYLSQLEILMQYFVRPLQKQAIIDEASHTLLFGQIEMIHNLNGEFLCELEADVEKFAEAFMKMAPFFKLYSVYAFDYRNALFMLQDLTSRNPVFRKFLQQTESRPEVQRKLNSFMIAPIQRIPRYKLLLEQVLQYTSPADKDYKLLKESIKQIESTVSHINSCVEDQEVAQKLINIQNSLVNRTPNIVKPSRKVIREGVLNKVNRNGVEVKRYCVLMSDIFMYCKNLKDRAENTVVENALECCCIFPLKKCKVHKLFSGTFKVTCQGDAIILCTNNQLNCLSWVSLIQEAINLHIQCRKTLRKESSKRKPLRKKQLKKFGTDYDVLSPTKKKTDYETVFRNQSRTTESSDDESTFKDVLSLNCFKTQKHSKSSEKTETVTSTKIQEKPTHGDLGGCSPMLNNINDEISFGSSDLVIRRRALKRSAPPPPTPRPISQRTVCSPAYTRPKARNLSVKQKLQENFSQAYKRIRATKTTNSISTTSTGFHTEGGTTTTTARMTNSDQVDQFNANNENDASYAFTVSRYSDSKSYFRAHNVDTLPTAAKREGILLNLESSDHRMNSKDDDFGDNEFGNENFRDILYPLRCSGGSGKSSKDNCSETAGSVSQEIASSLKHSTFGNVFGYDYEARNQVPPKKKVKFETQTISNPFIFPEVVTSPSTSTSIATVLREKICNFFASFL